jgi:hypothetical protein
MLMQTPRGLADFARSSKQHSPTEIRATVQGHVTSELTRTEAFALLAASDDPEREALLASVVENPREDSRQRSAAAIALGHVLSPHAERLLSRAARNAPPEVLPEVLTALGRIGGTDALDVIDQFLTTTSKSVGAAARFAGALIAHRFGLAGHDLPVPSARELLPEPSANARPIVVGPPAPEEARTILASLAREPYGVALHAASMLQFRCGTDVNTLCLNEEFIGTHSARLLLERKALLGLVALESRTPGEHTISYVLLSTPSPMRATLDLLAPRCNGSAALGGSGTAVGEEIRFALRSIDRPGARAVTLDGTLRSGHVALRVALISTTRRPAPRPHRGAADPPMA